MNDHLKKNFKFNDYEAQFMEEIEEATNVQTVVTNE
jgi:hypothetical protein